MTGVLRSATTWIIASLLGISVYSVMLSQQLAVERDLSIERAERADERNEQLNVLMGWQREQLDVLHESLRVRERVLSEVRDDIADARESAGGLEQDDEIAEWADSPIDSSIIDWVRQLRAAGAGALDSVSDGAGISDESAARPDTRD